MGGATDNTAGFEVRHLSLPLLGVSPLRSLTASPLSVFSSEMGIRDDYCAYEKNVPDTERLDIEGAQFSWKLLPCVPPGHALALPGPCSFEKMFPHPEPCW